MNTVAIAAVLLLLAGFIPLLYALTSPSLRTRGQWLMVACALALWVAALLAQVLVIFGLDRIGGL